MRVTKPLLLLVLLCLLLSSGTALGATWHVATDGSDGSGDGSAGEPWATIGYAVNTGIPAEGGHTVLVHDGEYLGTQYISRGFASPVVVRAENPLQVKLSNVDGGNEVLRVYHDGPVRLTIEGFIMSNADPAGYACNGRESYYVIHIQDAQQLTLRGNIIYGAAAAGRCNELLKINRGSDQAYPKEILVEGNVFYDPANAGGADMIDSVRPGELDIVGNIFLGNPGADQSQSFITIKRQAPTSGARSPRYRVSRNIFLNWGGKGDQAFVQFGEDGAADMEITDALVENNLVIGNSAASQAAPFQFKGASGIVTRANTIVGDLPSGSFGFRIGTEGDNPPMSDFEIRNNIWSDPTGTMSDRLINTYGDVDNGSFELVNNLYWNGGDGLPGGGDVPISADPAAVEGDPLLNNDHAGLILPRWDEGAASFSSGETSIEAEFLRLVEGYGALAPGSPAIGAADPAHMPVVDIRGLARDGEPDIGAYEYQASSPVEPGLDTGDSSPPDMAGDTGTGTDTSVTDDTGSGVDDMARPDSSPGGDSTAVSDTGAGPDGSSVLDTATSIPDSDEQPEAEVSEPDGGEEGCSCSVRRPGGSDRTIGLLLSVLFGLGLLCRRRR